VKVDLDGLQILGTILAGALALRQHRPSASTARPPIPVGPMANGPRGSAGFVAGVVRYRSFLYGLPEAEAPVRPIP
jgi:hypothetical protein